MSSRRRTVQGTMRVYRYKRLKGFLCLLLFACLLIHPLEVKAGLPKGNFKVNQYWNKKGELKKIRKQIFQEMKTWGMTDEAICGVLGNMSAESAGCDYTLTQGWVKWSKVRYGGTGLGLTQWTHPTRQDRLFKMAKKMNMGWNELPPQMALLKEELTKSEYVKWKTFSKSTDMKYCTREFLYKYERPAVKNLNERYKRAKQMYKELKGTEAKALDGSATNGTEDGEGKNDEKKSSVKSVLDEWDLEGMPAKSKLLDNIEQIEALDYSSLSTGENYSVQVVADDLYTTKAENIVDIARTGVVFVGLMLIFYCILLLLAVLFDKSNQFLEISLVSVLTFGRLKFSEEDFSSGREGYAGMGKIFKSVVIILIVGFFLVSGGVFAYLSRFMLFVMERVSL